MVGREPGASRYQVVDAVLLILFGAEWLRAIRLPRLVVAAVSVVVAHNPYLSGVTAGRYGEQSRAHGAPAFDTPAQLAAAPAGLQQAADSGLASAYGLRPVPAHARSRRTCRPLAAGATAAGAAMALDSGRVLIRNQGKSPLIAYLRRFAPTGYSDPVGFLAGRTTSRLEFPRDGVDERWRLTLRDTTGARRMAALACPRG